MPLFTWDNEYSVGVGSMDAHHKTLFDIMNKLHDAMKSGQAEEKIASTIRELVDYTIYHFAEEEKIMESINYAGIAAQKREHTVFVDKMNEYKEKADAGQAIFTVAEVADTSVRWLREHILGMDKKYESSMKSAGIA